MKTLRFICLLAMILNFIVATYFFAHRTTGKQFFFMAVDISAIGLTVIAIVAGIYRAFRGKHRPFVSALICVIGLPAGMIMADFLAGSFQNWRFRHDLPHYEAIVKMIEKGDLKPSLQNGSVTLPADYADLAWATIPATNNHGLSIAFMTETGFPVKHSGYLFVSSGNMETDTNALHVWSYYSRISTNWFRISD